MADQKPTPSARVHPDDRSRIGLHTTFVQQLSLTYYTHNLVGVIVGVRFGLTY